MDTQQRERKIREHLEAIRELQARPEPASATWPPRGYYLFWHVLVGMTLGLGGALVSLLGNVIGAPLFGLPPLHLIRVFLTFPMGAQALTAEGGLVLTVGCVLYLATGALYGIAFHVLMTTVFAHAPRGRRWLVASLIGLGLWIANFYLVLSWLQPLLLDGNWIVKMVPWWVAAVTHLAFVWTMLALESWGRFDPYLVRPAPGRAPAALVGALLISGAAVAGAGEASPGPPRVPAYDEWSTVPPGGHLGYNQRANLLVRGRVVYERHCEGCHGAKGDGAGPAAARLLTRPRDFTSGTYKFRSTDSSSLPLETDLERTITRGLSRVSMPAFPLLTGHEKTAVIAYVKSFYPAWERNAKERVVVPVPRAPRDLASRRRIERGRIVFVTMQCGSCHGDDGRGGDTVFTDAWGYPQKAFDFTRGALKSGPDPEDVYRTFHTGLISVMPAYGGTALAASHREAFEAQAARLAPGERDALAAALADFPANGAAIFGALAPAELADLAERNSWDLVAYILSLHTRTSTAAAVIGGTK